MQGISSPKALELFLVRLVFCLFADDTGIFEPREIFLDYLTHRTSEDGSWAARARISFQDRRMKSGGWRSLQRDHNDAGWSQK